MRGSALSSQRLSLFYDAEAFYDVQDTKRIDTLTKHLLRHWFLFSFYTLLLL